MGEVKPSRVRLSTTVTGDWPVGHMAMAGPGEYDCEVNKHGAVSIVADNGKLLGLKPYEFEVVEYRQIN